MLRSSPLEVELEECYSSGALEKMFNRNNIVKMNKPACRKKVVHQALLNTEICMFNINWVENENSGDTWEFDNQWMKAILYRYNNEQQNPIAFTFNINMINSEAQYMKYGKKKVCSYYMIYIIQCTSKYIITV